MSRLSPQAQRIVALSRRGDDPSGADQHRVRLALAQKLGAGATATFVNVGGAKSAVGTTAVAGFGKGTVLVSACIALAAAMTQPRAMNFKPVADKATFTSSNVPRFAPHAHAEQSSSAHATVTGGTQPAMARSKSLPDSDRALARPAAGTPDPKATAEPSSVTKIVNPGTAVLGASNVDPLLAETAALREAQGALHSGAPARAIALIDAQDTVYSAGKLRQERAAIRVYALCALGHVARARTEAQVFARRWPRSPMLSRVRAACDSP